MNGMKGNEADFAAILKTSYNRCDFETPLEWNDPRRVDFNERGLRGRTPVIDEIQMRIEASAGPAYELFSGFRGTGKSTELLALKQRLQEQGFKVIYIDSFEYLNLTVPVNISDVLVTVAAGFDEYLEQHDLSLERPFWRRTLDFLRKTEVEVDEVSVGIKGIAEFKGRLRQDFPFRRRLAEQVEKRLPEFAQDCRSFIDEAIAKLKQAQRGNEGIVLIFDSLEKLRAGAADRIEEVRHSIETVFNERWEFLQIPCHAVYTVPAWLKFTPAAPSLANRGFSLLPTCKVWDSESGAEYGRGIEAMVEVLRRRAPLDDLFENGGGEPLRELARVTGGYPRDLLRMMRDVIIRLLGLLRKGSVRLPVPKAVLREIVDELVQEHADQYAYALLEEYKPLVRRIGEQRQITGLRREDLSALADLFDHHFIFGYRNGREWFDLHPLLRRALSPPSAGEAVPNEDAAHGGESRT